MLTSWLHPLPLLAILRGVTPAETGPIGQTLVKAGFRILEVPFNSAQAIESIAQLVAALGDQVMIGAGTVRREHDMALVAAAGGRLIVMPHTDVTLIRATKSAGLLCIPGVATPSEAFAALDAGADGLKLFPAEQMTPTVLKAWRAVIPREVATLPVGGITPDTMPGWIAAGASGFGIGSALYTPNRSITEIASRAHAFAKAWQRETAAGPVTSVQTKLPGL